MKPSLLLRIVAACLPLVFVIGAAGCGTEWENLALELLEQWADQHDVNPSTAGGAANLLTRSASGSTGDEEADAAIGYGDIVRNVEEEGEEPPEELNGDGDKDEPDSERDREADRDAKDDQDSEKTPEGAATYPANTGDAPVSDDPASHVEGFISGEVAEATGSAVIEDRSAGATWDQMVEELSDRVKSPSNVTAESSDALFDKVRDLIYDQDPESGLFERSRASGHDTMEITLGDGEKMQIGIMVTPEGRILYTGNGKDYYDDLATITDPGITQQVSDAYTGIKDAAWSALFEGSTRNPDIDLQNRVASEVMDDLRTQLDAGETPKSVMDWTEGQLWDKNVKGPLQENVQQMLWSGAEDYLRQRIADGPFIPRKEDVQALELLREMKYEFDDGKTTTPKAWGEIKKQAGLDLFELVEVDGFKAGELAVSGAEFALEATKTMGRGLQDTDFALRSRAYIAERNAGASPQLIWERMRNGELPELDIGSAKAASGGVSSMMAQSSVAQEAQLGVMFTMYEQAYQRYNVAKEMGK